MKAQEIINKIITDSCGNFRLDKTADILISGSPDTDVSGIVTTFMATIEVIRKAIKHGANMIITHEPTFYTGHDTTQWLEDDPVFKEKMKLINDNGIVIWRYHDYMHMAKPDRIYEGLYKQLGWELIKKDTRDDPWNVEIEETTVGALAKSLKEKLHMETIQIVGKLEDPVKKICILVGGGSLGFNGKEEMPAEIMKKENSDVVICGEILEWTLCSYINDARMLGIPKAMIVVGHERTEEWGMKYMAEWLPALIGEIPVTFVDAGEPFKYL